MSIAAATGQSVDLDGREAAAQAANAALTKLGAIKPVAALVCASDEYDPQQLLTGLSAQLADTPIFGFSAGAQFGPAGLARRSVALALLGGDGLAARGGWAAGFSEQGHRAMEQVGLTLGLGVNSRGALLLAGSLQNGDGASASASLPPGAYTLAGGIAGGDLRRGRNFQLGGGQSGNNGLAAMYISGNLAAGVGHGHGWRPAGPYFKVTGMRGAWLRALDGQPASEAYATTFGRPAREWAFPPLNELVRLYPLGIEIEDEPELQVRSALQVEGDGSLRLNSPLPENALAHLLVGSPEACLEAARRAAHEALERLSGTPRLALVLVDAAWQMLFTGQAGAELAAVREVLGADLPLVGGTTYGQFSKASAAGRAEFLNQHIVVLLLGDN